jgi:paired amphipathic helix protein Sin3a
MLLALIMTLLQDARVAQQEEVAAEVAQLFQDHPDLQADFRVFMPGDHSQMFGDSGDMALLRQRNGTPILDGKSKRKLDTTQLASAATLTVPQKRKRKVVEKEREREREKELPLKTGPSSKVAHIHLVSSLAAITDLSVDEVKKTKQHHISDISAPSPGYSHSRYPSSPSRRHHSQQQPQMSSTRSAATIPLQDDSHFFDRVKRVLDNRETYNEFLKLINLFTQDYIDMARLVREARSYLRDGELLKQFKDILGWDERRERESWAAEGQGLGKVVGGAGVMDRPSRAELNVRDGSYRKLPASVRASFLLCSQQSLKFCHRRSM